jgi:hypothetical protein
MASVVGNPWAVVGVIIGSTSTAMAWVDEHGDGVGRRARRWRGSPRRSSSRCAEGRESNVSDQCRPANHTTPPRVEDLSRHLDLTSPDPITVNLNDRRFRLPPHTRYYRWGVTQEGLLVEYRDPDGGWQDAEEIAE